MGNRKKDVEFIKKLSHSKKIRKVPEFQRRLNELRVCYFSGAYEAVHLLSSRVVEQYVEAIYLKDAQLLEFLLEREKAHSLNPHMEGVVLRDERSSSLEHIYTAARFIGTQRQIEKRKYRLKDARRIMKELALIFQMDQKSP